MKIELPSTGPSITPDQIDKNTHIVVGFINGNAVVMTMTGHDSGKFIWLILQDSLRCNHYEGDGGYKSIASAICEQAAVNSCRFEVFERWDKAMVWLTNAKPFSQD